MRRTLSKSTRTRLLSLASRLDRWAAGIRKYCAARTPKRPRKAESIS